MLNVRVFYEKKGRAKYISHLDTNRCMQRALKRSGLPVWYTEGFNPHLYITFALPLSLGFESEYEIMDFRLTEEIEFGVVKERLNANLPEGFLVFRAASPVYKPSAIEKAVFEVRLFGQNPDALYQQFAAFLDQSEIIVEKKTKKGRKSIDLKREIIKSEIGMGLDYIIWKVVLPAGVQKNINPSLFITEFEKKIPLEKADVLKKIVLCAGEEEIFL